MSTHNYHAPRTQTKEFELVTRARNASFGFPPRHQRIERTTAAGQTAPESSLLEFHEEFKSLVLAGEEAASDEDPVAASYLELFEPHEIEWNDWMGGAATTHPATVTVAQTVVPAPAIAAKHAPPQQAVRPLTGPRLGTPVPIESWVVKVIMVLVGLNLVFAGLIVTGLRLGTLFK